MKILYLLNNVRDESLQRIGEKKYHDNHLYGLLRIEKHGVEAEYLGVEKIFPLWLSRFIRKHFTIYFVHLPLIFKIWKYDVVFHTNAFAAQFVYTTLGFKKPKWVMYDFSVSGMMGECKTFKQRIFRYIVSRSAGIITISKREEEILRDKFPEKRDSIKFIYHGDDLEFFKPMNVTEANEIITVGLDPGRDYKTLFKATEGLGVKVIATKSHRTKALNGPVPEHVSVCSYTDTELVEAYARAKIVVIPLNTKGGHNDAMGCSTLMEAMAMGKAVITTETFTMKSYIESGKNGMLVKEGDVEAMKKAIVQVLGDNQLRKNLGQNARTFVEKNCQADKVAGEMANFFKSLNK